MLCPEKDSMSFHPLLSDGPENTQSSAEPAHLRGEMAGAEQVSQPPQNNILSLLQRRWVATDIRNTN